MRRVLRRLAKAVPFWLERAYATRGTYIPPRVSNEPASLRPIGAPQRALRIIVADDERDQVATLAAILVEEGHQVREVYRGSEVLRMVRNFDPDVALIDIGMPGMTGYDVAREIRQIYGKQRPLLIAVTGWKQSSDRILATLAGFDHHLPKPFEATALLKLLEPLASGS